MSTIVFCCVLLSLYYSTFFVIFCFVTIHQNLIFCRTETEKVAQFTMLPSKSEYVAYNNFLTYCSKCFETLLRLQRK